MKHHHQHLDDAAQLAAHGHKQELNRHYSPLYGFSGGLLNRIILADDDVHSAMLGLSFAILNVHLLTPAYLLACILLIINSFNIFFSHGLHYPQACLSHYLAVVRPLSSGVRRSILSFRMFANIHVGLVAAGVCNLCLAASLAEFLSAYPT